MKTEKPKMTRSQVAVLGGRAAHMGGKRKDGTKRKKGHEWTKDEARAAGQKGGEISRGGRGRVLVVANTDEEETREIEPNPLSGDDSPGEGDLVSEGEDADDQVDDDPSPPASPSRTDSALNIADVIGSTTIGK